MDRRKAIKGLGLSLGYVIATPSVISILQSCKNDPQISWTPQFFSSNESFVLEKLIDLILPKTNDLPSALDVNIPQFIDAYVNEVSSKSEQEELKKGIATISESLSKSANNEAFKSLLTKYLKADQKDKEAFFENEDDTLVLETLINLRTMTIWTYKTSEKAGEEILAYDPIPGDFLGCISLEETTKGKAWSL